jgi:hypothetical protein
MDNDEAFIALFGCHDLVTCGFFLRHLAGMPSIVDGRLLGKLFCGFFIHGGGPFIGLCASLAPVAAHYNPKRRRVARHLRHASA